MRVPVIYRNDNFGQWRSDFRGNVDVRDAVAAETSARMRRALDLLRTDRPVRVIATRAALRWLGA